MKKIVTILLVLLVCCVAFFACDKDNSINVNYALDNEFAVNLIETDAYTIFEPASADGKKVNYKYGLIFYLGTMIAPAFYSYLGNALAEQGYLMIVPNITLAYFQYKDVEDAFAMYPNVQFFVGGHSQGGGAALRRAEEMSNSILGAILFAPLVNRHAMLDEDGNPVLDENDIEIYVADSIKDKQIPTLLLEAEQDHVLTSDMKSATPNRLNLDTTTQYVLSPAAHMSFSTMDSDQILQTFLNDGDGITQQEKEEQRRLVVLYTLAFMQSTVLG